MRLANSILFITAPRLARVRLLGCTYQPVCRSVNPKTLSTRNLGGLLQYLYIKINQKS